MGFADKRFSKTPIPWRIIDGEMVLLDRHEGELIRLNPVGAEIWKAMDGHRTVWEIIDSIQATFEVSREQATRDVQRFVMQLVRQELVEEAREE